MNKVKVSKQKAKVTYLGDVRFDDFNWSDFGKEVVEDVYFNESTNAFTVVNEECDVAELKLDSALPKAAKRILKEAFLKASHDIISTRKGIFIPVKGYDVFYNKDWVIYSKFIINDECLRADKVRG